MLQKILIIDKSQISSFKGSFADYITIKKMCVLYNLRGIKNKSLHYVICDGTLELFNKSLLQKNLKLNFYQISPPNFFYKSLKLFPPANEEKSKMRSKHNRKGGEVEYPFQLYTYFPPNMFCIFLFKYDHMEQMTSISYAIKQQKYCWIYIK